MIKVVLDTNIIISSIFWRGNPYKVVKKGILGEYQIVTSVEILDEVVDRLKNKFKLPDERIKQLVNIFFTYSHIVQTKSKFKIVRDKKDNKIIECAFDGKADYIVTGDSDLLIMKNFKGIKIVKAKKFLEEIK